MDLTLWAKPVGEAVVDLAGRAAQMLMQRCNGEGLCTTYEAFSELKARSLSRRDVHEIAFWAANTGWCVVNEAEDPRRFVDAVAELIEWVRPHHDWPDMGDVIGDAIENEWITDDFKLGRQAIESLFELFKDSLLAAQGRRDGLSRDNSFRTTREELNLALDSCADNEWAAAIRAQAIALEAQVQMAVESQEGIDACRM
jgi:hypothetical protein